MIIDLKDYYPDDTTPLINLINDVNKHSVNPNSYGSSYLYLLNNKDIWVLADNPHRKSKLMFIGVINSLTLKMEIKITNKTEVIDSRYDGMVEKVLLNRYPTKLIKIIKENAKAIKEARSLIGL